jgi:hypothetical protein
MTIPAGRLNGFASPMRTVAAIADAMPLAVMSAMIVMIMTMGVMTGTMVMRRPRRGRGRRKRNDRQRTQDKDRESNCPIQRTQLNHPKIPLHPRMHAGPRTEPASSGLKQLRYGEKKARGMRLSAISRRFTANLM